VGARIRAERVASGLSQEAAAAAALVGYKHWQEIEGGRASPTLQTLIRIAQALDIDLHAIVCSKESGVGKRRKAKER
jgi:transcriptional regulator with XRE-family HTH domain